MHENRYLRRIIDEAAEFALKSRGALVISGPKWCGKSTTAKRYAKTVINLLLPDTRNEFIELARISPTHFLNYGPKPLLVWLVNLVCPKIHGKFNLICPKFCFGLIYFVHV